MRKRGCMMNSRLYMFCVVIITLIFFATGCSINLPVVGLSQKYNEVFRGVAVANMRGSS
jgi:hypothetical protein